MHMDTPSVNTRMDIEKRFEAKVYRVTKARKITTYSYMRAGSNYQEKGTLAKFCKRAFYLYYTYGYYHQRGSPIVPA